MPRTFLTRPKEHSETLELRINTKSTLGFTEDDQIQLTYPNINSRNLVLILRFQNSENKSTGWLYEPKKTLVMILLNPHTVSSKGVTDQSIGQKRIEKEDIKVKLLIIALYRH
ncbi:unnamed protein product, partial [Brassica rapa subsp. trilocularis]